MVPVVDMVPVVPLAPVLPVIPVVPVLPCGTQDPISCIICQKNYSSKKLFIWNRSMYFLSSFTCGTCKKPMGRGTASRGTRLPATLKTCPASLKPSATTVKRNSQPDFPNTCYCGLKLAIPSNHCTAKHIPGQAVGTEGSALSPNTKPSDTTTVAISFQEYPCWSGIC